MINSLVKSILILRAVSTLVVGLEVNTATILRAEPKLTPTQDQQRQQAPPSPAISNQISHGLEPRMSDNNFIADILNRLHSLDADIGKLLFNSSSMYAADDQSEAFKQNQPQGGERFTEVLSDLDSLQDEVRDTLDD